MGLVSYNRLPVSLLPDIDIPKIIIQLDYEDYSAQDMEHNLASRIRQYVLQCSGLKDISSESSFGQSTIYLEFEYGIDIDLAAIEVNEKIDRAAPGLPKDMNRPRVIKSSVSDIPVFFLNMAFKEKSNENNNFLDLSRFAGNVIKKRLEQLPEVSFVDISGVELPQISIKLDDRTLRSYGITSRTVEDVINANNYSLGNINIRDGYYQYNVQFSSQMNTIAEIKDLLLNIKGKIVRLDELATIEVVPASTGGSFMADGQKAISLAIIKQGDARMQDLKKQLDLETNHIKNDYPSIAFTVAQDQTTLLEYSISNLKQTLMYGGILAFVVLLVFIPNLRLPFLIAITVPISITISLLFFMLFGISINIISLSGLVLGIGLMIDNSIIVIDNITQFREREVPLFEACLQATKEIVVPLLSSACTTSAIFIPLVFVSGMAGALFYDQAVTVTVSLLVSFIVSITLLPVLYRIFHYNLKNDKPVNRKALIDLQKPYEKGMDFVFKHKVIFTITFLMMIPCSYLLFFAVPKELFPDIKQDDAVMTFKWNENLSKQEQLLRLERLHEELKGSLSQFNAWSGSQTYILNSDYNLKNQEVEIYIKAAVDKEISEGMDLAMNYFKNQYPKVKVVFKKTENVFVKTFDQSKAPLIVKLKPKDRAIGDKLVLDAAHKIDQEIKMEHFNSLGQFNYINLLYDREKMLLYDVNEGNLLRTLKTAFNQNNIGRLNTSQEVLPIMVGTRDQKLEDILKFSTVQNSKGENLPLGLFIDVNLESDFEVIQADENGIFIPLFYNIDEDSLPSIQDEIENINQDSSFLFDLNLEGGLYDFNDNFQELLAILLLSIALLYFILAIQFESLSLPLIILLEIPMDICGAFILLLITGTSLNVMSIIGIIVMTGIIINDSILKIDTIHRLYHKERYDLQEAIFLGGKRRLRPILLTSLTTMLALSPFFFGDGLGTELQRPLAVTLVGGLGLGTLVSLYFIPLCYWWLYKDNLRTDTIRKLDI